MKSRSAFTLIEVLVVISIMGILASMAMLDFRSSREIQSRDSAIKIVQSELQQNRLDVQSGLKENENFLCLGMEFSLDQAPQELLAEYDVESASCTEIETRSILYFPSSKSALPESIVLDSIEIDKLKVLFVPPEGDLLLLDAGGDEMIGDLTLKWGKAELELSELLDRSTLNLIEDETEN